MLRVYRDEVRETLQDFPDASLVERVGLGAITICGLYAERRLETEAVRLPAVEVVWDSPDLEAAVLEKELEEMQGESRTTS